MPALVDLSGMKFARLAVLRRDGCAPSGPIKWLCRCDCGNYVSVVGQNLKCGNTKSCGCYHVETATARQKELADAAVTHGMSQSPEYKSWRCMLARCYTPSDKRYQEYSSRGIAVCDEWRVSFQAFFANVGPRPSPQHTVDRIDNDKGYFPGNVRWATRTEQNNNKRTTPRYVYRGNLMPFMDIYRVAAPSFTASGVRVRLKRGLGIEEALGGPAG